MMKHKFLHFGGVDGTIWDMAVLACPDAASSHAHKGAFTWVVAHASKQPRQQRQAWHTSCTCSTTDVYTRPIS
jgi:hypothetical protein